MWQSPKPWFEMLTVDIKDGEMVSGWKGWHPGQQGGVGFSILSQSWKLEKQSWKLCLKSLWLILLATERYRMPIDTIMPEPPLIPKAGLCPTVKRRDEIIKGRSLDRDHDHKRCCSPQSHLVHIPSSSTWLLSTNFVLGLERSQVCVAGAAGEDFVAKGESC